MKKVGLKQHILSFKKTSLTKAFTLIEMVFVMIILGIMTMMTLKMTTSQIEKVQHKSVKEALLTAYQKYYTKNITSSYYKGHHYDNLFITFNSGDNQFTFEFSGNEISQNIENMTGAFQSEFKIINLNSSETDINNENNQVTLKLTPYQLGCTISGGNLPDIETLYIDLLVQDQKEYCFEISSKTCRMRELDCEYDYTNDTPEKTIIEI